MIPLAREDLLEVRQSARPTFFIRSRVNSGLYFSNLSRATYGAVDKNTLCGKQATTSFAVVAILTP